MDRLLHRALVLALILAALSVARLAWLASEACVSWDARNTVEAAYYNNLRQALEDQVNAAPEKEPERADALPPW